MAELLYHVLYLIVELDFYDRCNEVGWMLEMDVKVE